ncbi:MAG: hypothetical protein OEV09_02395 [Deltaproteobacteria bacterium]|nr:hypothetical protein [Deltaproteobacteria bacterium]
MTIYLFNTVFNPNLALIISSADCCINMGSIPLQIYAAIALLQVTLLGLARRVRISHCEVAEAIR